MASDNKHYDIEAQQLEAVIHLAEQLAAEDVRDGYTHIGMATSGFFRFKWTARLQRDGRFIVEETVGGGTVAVRSRPLVKDDVRAYIDQRQRGIQAKVDEVRRELAGIQGFDADAPSDAGRDPMQVYDEIRRMLKDGTMQLRGH